MSAVGDLKQLCQSNPEVKSYLDAQVFPVVRDGFESLLKELDFRERRAGEGEELPPIQPLLFMAQYLMRNNPNDRPQI
jgi:hypothetical protein